MNYPSFFNPQNSSKLFGMEDNFNFLHNLYLDKKLPKILMFSGGKGIGKFTLINHFLYSIFDSKNYNLNEYSFNESSNILKQLKNNIFSNVIYINGSDFKSVKIEDIRNLKKKILQSTILNKDRFIILDDIDIFNTNSLNALLKIIEEPTKNNYFFLINNKSKVILDTVKSRSIEIKILIKNSQRLEIIKKLINNHNLELTLDPNISKISPGNFIKFNYICKEYDISPSENYIENLSLLLNLYKKNKEKLFINLAYFISDFYLNSENRKNNLKNDKIYEIKNFIFSNLNSFMMYNINQNSLVNSVNSKLNNE
jgi:DNA polymerase-3 subunit delta'